QGLIFHPALLACVLVAGALFLITYAGGRSRLSAIDYCVILLGAAMLVSILFGPRTWKEAAAQLWTWVPPYIAGRVIAARRPLNRPLAVGTVIVALASVGFAVVEALGVGSPFFGVAQPNNPAVSPWDQAHLRPGEAFRVQASFGHPIAYSMFLAVAIVFALVLVGSTDDRRRKRLYLCATAI